VTCLLCTGKVTNCLYTKIDAFSPLFDFLQLPEDLLTAIASKSVPVQMLWGEEDPWEDINLGRKFFAGLPSVKVGIQKSVDWREHEAFLLGAEYTLNRRSCLFQLMAHIQPDSWHKR